MCYFLPTGYWTMNHMRNIKEMLSIPTGARWVAQVCYKQSSQFIKMYLTLWYGRHGCICNRVSRNICGGSVYLCVWHSLFFCFSACLCLLCYTINIIQECSYQWLLQFYRLSGFFGVSVLARKFSKPVTGYEFVIHGLPTKLRGEIHLLCCLCWFNTKLFWVPKSLH